MTLRTLAIKATCMILCGVVTVAHSTTALAQSTASPKNLRVTGVTDWTVSLMWDAPKGKAPSSYVIQCSNGRTMTVAGSQTSATFSAGFDYNRSYSFRVYAVSGGAWSAASNSVTATLLKDTTPAAKPVVAAAGIGPTHIDLTWSYADVDPNPRFDIYVNGEIQYLQVAGTSKRLVFLSPGTSYTIRVSARDSAGNRSELSEPLVAITPAADATDDDPPTMPPDWWGGVIDGANEAMVFWGDSQDNVTPREHIRYFLYVNRQFDGATVDPYPHQFSMYLTLGIVNTIEVYAVDEAGNRSAPAVMTIDLR
ncbi:MAG TPA: fibronectin type III domain-containing protein [Vicinamibacterales bacterium]|nr:fibronectin type III domain-containing protein [Vicinamibacterales bacterium]